MINASLNITGMNGSLFTSMDNVFNNHTCVLNQMSMMRATDNLYKVSFWLALIMFFFLIFYFYIQPKFKVLEDFCGIDTLRSVAGINILLVLILLYTNLGLSVETLNVVQNCLWIVLILIGLYLCWIWYNSKRDKNI
jgi:hypothetical protein